jgi:hypothetical protein
VPDENAIFNNPPHQFGVAIYLTGSTCLSCVQFLCKVFEDDDDDDKARAERSDHELALAKAVDAMAMGLEKDVEPADLLKPENICSDRPASGDGGSPAWRSKDYRKIAVLYMLLSACVADVNMAEDGVGSPRVRKGYDARHRVALRLVATWIDVKWNKMVSTSSIGICILRSPSLHYCKIASHSIQCSTSTFFVNPASWHCRKLSR